MKIAIIFLLATLNLCWQQKKIDTFPIERSIINIYLEDPSTTTSVLGLDVWNKRFEADNLFPRIECLNRFYTEGMRLFFHYGGTKNAVAEFEVFLVNKGYKKPIKAIQLNVVQFKSGKGLFLGQAREEVIRILGKGFESKKKNREEELIYYTDNPNSEVLKIYNGVAYFIKCRFQAGRLIKYNFGFEYP